MQWTDSSCCSGAASQHGVVRAGGCARRCPLAEAWVLLHHVQQRFLVHHFMLQHHLKHPAARRHERGVLVLEPCLTHRIGTSLRVADGGRSTKHRQHQAGDAAADLAAICSNLSGMRPHAVVAVDGG